MTDAPISKDVRLRARAESDFAGARTEDEKAAVIARVRKIDPALADELAARA